MLSRLAESSFWLGRYLERTEGISRLLLEYHQLLTQDQRAHVARGCALLTHGLGLGETANNPTELVEIVYGNPNDPSTILGALQGARANARSIRDTLPSDFYESINRLNAASESFQIDVAGRSLKNILDRLAVSNGIYEWLAPGDEASHFFALGRSLERMELVSRLLSLNIETEWKDQGPATTLRAIGGLSTFTKARVPISALRVRHFLVRDDSFPRSLIQSGRSSEMALKEIAKITGINSDDILRPIGLLGSQILYLGDDQEEQESLIHQTPSAVEQTTEGIRLRYFRPMGSIVWSN